MTTPRRERWFLLAALHVLVACTGPASSTEDVPDASVDARAEDATTLDGGSTDDGGACVPEVERCDGVDQDCDERVDEESDALLCPGTNRGSAQCREGACATHAWGWDRVWGGDGAAIGTSVAVDDAGNAYVGGSIVAVDFGDGLHTHGGTGAALVSYDASGELRWARSWGGVGDHSTDAVSVSADGTVLALVVSHGGGATIDFGGGSRTTSTQATFVVQLDASGGYLSDHRVADGFFWSQDMAVSDTTIVVGGYLWNTGADLGSGRRVPPYPLAGAVVVVDRATMTPRWDRVVAADGAVTGVALTNDGRVVIAGMFGESADLGGGVRDVVGNAAFVAAYSASGAPAWDRVLDTDDNEFAVGLAADGESVITVVQAATSEPIDAYALSLDATGADRWRHGLGAVWVYGFGMSPDGIALAGSFTTTADLGGGARTVDGRASFLAVLGRDGAFAWDVNARVTSTSGGFMGVARASYGWVLTGDLYGSIDLGARTVDRTGGDGYSDGVVLTVLDD